MLPNRIINNAWKSIGEHALFSFYCFFDIINITSCSLCCLIVTISLNGRILIFMKLRYLILWMMVMVFCMTSAAFAATPKPISTIPWDKLPDTFDGQHHYLLLCIDQWNEKGRPADAKAPVNKEGHRLDRYGNTDGIVIVTLDTRSHRIMLTSIIRDALIVKPGSTEDNQKFGRINYVYNDSGPEALCRVISEHLGLKIEKFILFNFSQIQEIVSYLGGVDIELDNGEINYLHRYRVPKGSVVSLDGKHDVYNNGSHPAGVYHFNGHSAVLYMRIRKVSGNGDFMRTQRVRTVLSTLADTCRTMTWEQAQDLANNIMDNNNVTNLNLEEMLQAAEYAWNLRDCTVEELRIPPEGAVHPIDFANMSAQELDWEACRQAMASYLQNSFLVLDEED